MNPDFWNILHDDFITRVSGSVPGDVQLGVVPAVAAARIARRSFADTPRLIPAQVRTLRAFLLMALGSGVGVILAAKLAAGTGVR